MQESAEELALPAKAVQPISQREASLLHDLAYRDGTASLPFALSCYNLDNASLGRSDGILRRMLLDCHSLSRGELESLLRRLQGNLEDLEETIQFNLTYSSTHIGGAQIRKDEHSLNELREKIASLRQLLSEPDAPG